MGIITIARTHGSGGTLFAEALAKNLEYKCINRTSFNDHWQAINDHAGVFGLQSEESPSFLEWLQELMSNRHFFKISLLANIYHCALQNNVVLVGMGAGIILSGIENVLHLRVVRLFSERVKAIAEVKNIPYDDAFDLVEKMDDGKKDFVSRYFDADINEPTLYHLTINTSYLKFDDALNMISDYAKNHLTFTHPAETGEFFRNRLLEKRAEILLFRLGMADSYGKISFEAVDDGMLIVKGAAAGAEEKERLFASLNKNKEIKKIDDCLNVGMPSERHY
jgi:cytidylate kinase